MIPICSNINAVNNDDTDGCVKRATTVGLERIIKKVSPSRLEQNSGYQRYLTKKVDKLHNIYLLHL